MKVMVFVGLVIYLCTSFMALGAMDSDSCECPQLSCDPCSEQRGLSFYSEKCAGGAGVKSCAKPRCVPIVPAPKSCQTANKEKKTRSIASDTSKETFKAKSETQGKKVATAIVVNGKAWVKGAGAQKMKLVKGTRLHEKDLLITEKSGRVKVKFDDGNEFNLTPNTELRILRAKILAAREKRQTVLELIKGKVRSKVLKKYKGANHYYRVKTKSAVAGVRGTDFVVSYSDKSKVVTTVQTLSGSVELADTERSQKRVINKNSKASFVIAANSSDVFNDDEIGEFVAKGYMTPVYKMTASEVKDIDWSTKVVEGMSETAIAKAKESGDSICHAPRAKLNQCSWVCKNNPKGQKICRTDLPNVSCFRKRCNANGKWAEESRLPASFSNVCLPYKSKVGDCDY